MSDTLVKLLIRFGGWWEKNNEKWVYTSNEPGHRVKVLPTIQHSVLLSCVQSKCGIDPSYGITKLSYLYNGQVFELNSDQTVYSYLAFAASVNRPATIFVSVHYPVVQQNQGSTSAGVPEIEDEGAEDEEDGDEEEESEEDDDAYCFEENDHDAEVDENHVLHLPGVDSDEEVVPETQPETQPESPPITSYAGRNDFFARPPLLPDVDSEPIVEEEHVPYARSRAISEADVFQTKQEMILALSLKFIEESFQFKVKRSSKTRYEAICIYDTHCQWRMTAVSVGSTGMFVVRSINDNHTCSRTQLHSSHRQANRRVLGHIIVPQLRDSSRTLRGKDIVTDIKRNLKVNISYWQAWRAKAAALCMINGSPAESFTRLPGYFYNLELHNPGTITRIRTDSERRFTMCFAAFGTSIRTFRRNLRPVVVIDGAHLKGRYLGTMFLAVGMDANNRCVPISFGVGRSENNETWTWFLSMFKECVGDIEGMVFISDRAPSIKYAIETVFPNSHHALCCRHLMMNVKARDKRVKHQKKMFWKTCRAYTAETFERRMLCLRAAIPDGASVLDELGPDKWSNAYFPGKRYNILTSNHAESVNAMSRFARKLPIVGLFDYFRESQQEWFSERRKLQVKNGMVAKWNGVLAKIPEQIVKRRKIKSANWTVREIGYGRFEVIDLKRNPTVDFYNSKCECMKWQLSGLPCSHGIAVANYVRLPDCNHLAEEYFKTIKLQSTYAEVIQPAGPPETWVVPSDYRLMTVKPPLIKPKGPGRWGDHNRIPSVGEDRTTPRCSRCQEYGHTRNLCTANIPSQVRREQASGMQENLNTQQSYRHETFDLNVDANIDLNF
ncbi:hypothetical protein OSB04_025396 [Centaurea solstitialis]|uniref:SWIM-type domain-containing protein n=1 Tax=Centaurea solstitialis TaxID=347529 RepID=A0AA38WD17_9ASTR|nr:hypothetical protein OSB04_025396 [Centaurea solstitialis]